ncbi:MAG: amidohydrolase family protein [Ruminococcus sp.]|nr:amidohydrolase family protein [Ruminococcus sp.]
MIDFHTHMFPDKIAGKTLDFLSKRCKTTPFTDGTAAGLEQSAKEAGLECSVVLPVVTNPEQFESINRFAGEHRNGRLLSFGGIHPDNENYREKLLELKKRGFSGIKLHPDYQDTFFNDIRYKRILDYASELGLIVSVHAGFDPGYPECVHCTPAMAREVIEEVHPEKLVLAHMGGFQRWDEVEQELVGKNVWFDTAVVFGKIPDEQFLRICRNHGTDRILFATDSPWSGQKESVEYFRQMDFSEEEKHRILSENARKLLTL